MIKKILFLTATVALLASCSNQSTTSSTSTSEIGTNQQEAVDSTANTVSGIIEFENTSYDFGQVKEGEIVEHIFKFKNTGEAPVILAQVSASCGCTTPDYTREPVLPGKEGQIKVSFDSKGQVGNQQKIVTIISNAENRVTTVQIKGIVEG